MASAISKPFTLLLLLTVLLLASSIMHVESIPAPVYPVECIVRCKTAIPTCIKNCFGSGRSTSNGGSNKIIREDQIVMVDANIVLFHAKKIT
ncbi:hypothetical protein AQUCO_04900017v1 [Aquilegia coerulea]|uniref:Uncharacterized protein n=1 Tax=Aquilegia coerulea TaxID=218851 RepID=A0A2G5CJG5_AQUCA|nr:hypothetical protein AQUCO_04900017v1 [Aquilegia coerulea]